MKGVRKKRGWVYRASLLCVTVSAICAGVLSLVTILWFIVAFCPLTANSGLSLVAVQGRIHVDYYPNYSKAVSVSVARTPLKPRWLGFRWSYYQAGSHGNMYPGIVRWSLEFPLWAAYALLMVWPTIATFRLIRSYPHLPDICPACGYDLRGSVGSGSCPECGAGIVGAGKVKQG